MRKKRHAVRNTHTSWEITEGLGGKRPWTLWRRQHYAIENSWNGSNALRVCAAHTPSYCARTVYNNFDLIADHEEEQGKREKTVRERERETFGQKAVSSYPFFSNEFVLNGFKDWWAPPPKCIWGVGMFFFNFLVISAPLWYNHFPLSSSVDLS